MVTKIFEAATSSVVGDGPPLSSGWIGGSRMDASRTLRHVYSL
jgi:hypothetical protein